VERHPDSDTLQAFREHRLSGSSVTEVALHVERCAQCARLHTTSGATALAALVSADEHLTDEEIDVLVDGRVDDPSFRLISRHVAVCARCRAEVEDLRAFDRERAARGGRFHPAWLIAAAVALAVIGLTFFATRVQRNETQVVPVAVSTVAPAPPASPVIASLADGATRIALREDGTIDGIAVKSERDAADVRIALTGRALSIPTFVAAMPGAVRGATPAAHPLRAVEPFRSAVRDARPRFSWTPVKGARGYRVAVFDANYDEIASSDALTATSWTPSKPLPAGVDLSWHVVAETGDGELSSAGSNRAEAVFRVLAPPVAEEVARAETESRDSHLLRGLVYSRNGLLHDAEREFRALAEQNPGSPIPETLIASVSKRE
jgi:hypothetical protein